MIKVIYFYVYTQLNRKEAMHARLQFFAKLTTFYLGLSGATAFAQATTQEEKLRLNGFPNLGVIHDSSHFDGRCRRDISQALNSLETRRNTDTHPELQRNHRINSQFGLVAQAVTDARVYSNPLADAIESAFFHEHPQ